jgi:hypothetical protein
MLLSEYIEFCQLQLNICLPRFLSLLQGFQPALPDRLYLFLCLIRCLSFDSDEVTRQRLYFFLCEIAVFKYRLVFLCRLSLGAFDLVLITLEDMLSECVFSGLLLLQCSLTLCGNGP